MHLLHAKPPHANPAWGHHRGHGPERVPAAHPGGCPQRARDAAGLRLLGAEAGGRTHEAPLTLLGTAASTAMASRVLSSMTRYM